MKRRRGQKKGNPKRPSVVAGTDEALPNAASRNAEDISGLGDFDHAGFDSDSGMEAETPSPRVSDHRPDKFANINSDGLIGKPAEKSGYGRVKVKLRTSKTLDSHPASSDAPTQSDTDRSSLQVGLDKQGVVTEKMEDSANSLSDLKIPVLGTSKKSGSIKIKTSRGMGSSSVNKSTSALLPQGDNTLQRDIRSPHLNPCYNKAELDAALVVIKKVMKMDAAEPFNVPVNPIALGIPDYFDVIDTPMDFGTICSNLENGVKYINSEDVYKDVQFIWDNCYKYNNKGDYILELLKRVKKNFTKYWTTAGLYSGHPRRLEGVQIIQVEDDATQSVQGKVHIKGAHSKHKKRRRHGIKRHKDDCLCAICVVRRRRLERKDNAQIVEDQIGSCDGNLASEFKQEGISLVESPCGEDTSSNMDNSLDQDADADLDEKGEVMKVDSSEQQYSTQLEKLEEKENQIDIERRGEGGTSELSLLGDRSGKESTSESLAQIPEDIGGGFQTNAEKEEISGHHGEEAAPIRQQKYKESLEKRQKTRVFEELLRFENPMLLKLCGTLFSDNPKSVWNGPHSLVQHHGSVRSSSIHAAISTFMK
ncbi:uncharacterized protein LOC131164611 [Malania oleifera]|uniref:uncharacterized protein LOC131164611 n=1 Tax=Malania oleifera TaxID=397392 RepID=UPI0025ADBC54|nr:uncharacterized protein LOC131164611 [Malania oleifera]